MPCRFVNFIAVFVKKSNFLPFSLVALYVSVILACNVVGNTKIHTLSHLIINPQYYVGHA